ncbi:TPA: serine/threonine protein kinase [Stenotrophomonas maltophilia]
MSDAPSAWVEDPTWKSSWSTLERLKGGGQGEAYRVRRRSDGKVGFLKVIKSKNVPERRVRFFREAAAYDSFGVSGIPRLIESNAHRHADVTVSPFIVTEFIEGDTLRLWRESRGDPSFDVAAKITLRLLEILQECHAQGCVHRDVKPDNIILEGGVAASVWLLDFGISYHDLADVDFQTEHWQEVGNRFLRLPELSAGSLSKQDPRSDICFAAGILFYLLSGEAPGVLEDSEGRLPHQRTAALAKLQQVASSQLARLLAFFDDAFATRMADRFSTVQAMYERLESLMQDQALSTSPDENLAALREILDTSVNRRLAATVGALGQALREAQKVFNIVQQSVGGGLSTSQTGWAVTGDGGRNTLSWSRPGSADSILTVIFEALPTGEELVLRLSGEAVYRTDLSNPSYGENFHVAIQTWLLARLRASLGDPNALPPEAEIFREIRPYATLDTAAIEAHKRKCFILAFVYDPTQPERGKLRWSLGYFLQNRRTRDIVNGTFVTALIPLSALSNISDILDHESMEESRWVVLDQQLHPLEQRVVYANAQEAERIVTELAQRYA